MRKILGFVVGSLSAMLLFFAYQNLADAGGEKGGGGKGSKGGKNPCVEFMKEVRAREIRTGRSVEPDLPGSRIWECETTEYQQSEESECNQALADTTCKARVAGTNFEVASAKYSWTTNKEGKKACEIECELKKKAGTDNPSPTASGSPTSSPSGSPTAITDPVATLVPAVSAVVVPIGGSPSGSPNGSPKASADPAATASPTPTTEIEKTCSEDQIVAQLKAIILKDHADILEKQFALTYAKVAYRALKDNTAKDLKTVESLIVKQSAQIDAQLKKDGQSAEVVKSIQALYDKMGKPLDYAAVTDLLKKLKGKTNYNVKATRADNLDVSAYILAARSLEAEPSNKALAYKDIDSAILWYQNVLAETLEAGIRKGKKGAASSNLQYASVRIAHMLEPLKYEADARGKTSKKAPTEADLLAQIERDSKELQALMEKAEDKLMAWYKENCQKKECPDCATNRIHDGERDNRWLKAVQGIIDEMEKDPNLRKTKATEGGKIIRPDKWDDNTELKIIAPTSTKPMTQSKAMNQSVNLNQANTQLQNNCSNPELTNQACIKIENTNPANGNNAVNNNAVNNNAVNNNAVNNNAVNNNATEPLKVVENAVKKLAQQGECDLSPSVEKQADGSIKVTVTVTKAGVAIGGPVVTTFSTTAAELKSEAAITTTVTDNVHGALTMSEVMIKAGYPCGQ